ncbi:MAG: tRNA (adenosine(37)-N6)-threonylcarbamoyltransferase complex transferase subunit TsaD [Chitinophagales bacterium]|nr:tRNA (adenosine(37)-N6)-threonylcarbamoyltransferase complex transferase subunit TsaD [Chitinophagales bacterium]MDW8393751.1 tRNA (adenosine(37)-N6)-threonylcarbamoyltransferase complex transferase subunit TsaD [Chitinophagales bacterium]
MPIRLLAIETSCDETAAAVIEDGRLLSSSLVSQLEHSKLGGIVPELASRQQLRAIVPVVEQALQQAGIAAGDLNGIGFTAGPGLIGSLMVGSSFAKAMALSLNLPLIAVHHLQAHVHALFLTEPRPGFPFLCLIVSGGHTQLVVVRDYLDMEVIGETRDDAAGEAFDKTARLLGLPYPGGPLMDQLAQSGDSEAFPFPEASVGGYDFSFSGLKTAVRYFIEQQVRQDPQFVQNHISDVCASVQRSIVRHLINKMEAAASDLQLSRLAIAGGVAANSLLRSELQRIAHRHNWQCFIPPLNLCTDNAAVIASVAYHKFLRGELAPLSVAPDARYRG